MKRRILLITNPGKKGDENYCAGVYKDQENYFSFFKQPFGGYWSDSELKHLDKPSKAAVIKEIDLLATDEIEFSIIIFCGHGWYSSISSSNILCLNDSNEEIDSLDFRVKANKRIIILDSCRKVHPEYITESVKMFGREILEKAMKLNPQECKKYYNAAISSCAKQIINSYGCDINEYCNDSSTSGGYYSSSLIKGARNWVDNKISTNIDLSKEYSALRFPAAHDTSIPNVIKLSGDTQHPQIDKPRADSNDYLPFAIVA